MVQFQTNGNGSVDVRLINKQSSDLNHKTSKNDALCRLTIAAILCFIFVIVEIIGGLLSSSLAILSDAAHLFADFASFIVAIFAERIARLPPNTSNTFGYHRAEALAALYSMSILLVVSLFLAAEALHRGYVFLVLADEEEPVVNGKIMSLTAGFGVVVNICLAFVLGGEHHHHGHSHDHSHDHGHWFALVGDNDDHHDHHDHSHREQHENHDHNDHHDHSHKGHDENHDHGNHHDHDHDHIGHKESHDHDHSHHHYSHHQHHDHSRDDDDDHHAHDHSLSHHHEDNDDDQFIVNDAENPIHPASTKSSSSTMEQNLNLKAAYLHVLTDLFQSFCVLCSGLVIWHKPQWQLLDPIVTILYCVFVIKTTYGMIRASVSVLMNDVPSRIDWMAVYNTIDAIEGVSNIRDLHIWSITSDSFALSVHVDGEDVENALSAIKCVCEDYGIHHTTIQVCPN